MDWLKRGLINFVATTYSAQGLVTKMTGVVGCYGYTLNRASVPRWQAIVVPTLGDGWNYCQHIVVGVLTLTEHSFNS